MYYKYSKVPTLYTVSLYLQYKTQSLSPSRDVVGPEGDLQSLQSLDGGHVGGSLAGLLGRVCLRHVL